MHDLLTKESLREFCMERGLELLSVEVNGSWGILPLCDVLCLLL